MDYKAILSGQRKDPLAFCFRGLLALAEIPYRAAISYRNAAFDRGRRDIFRSEVPVISIGNLTTGGTGKTPAVCYVAKRLREQGVRVAILSRGYGAAEGEENDEAMELARELPDVPHLQAADRAESARIAVEELDAELLLMDDGFQHRRLHRDLDIVLIDCTNPFGYGHLLPRGLLREPVSSLKRSQLVMLTRTDLVDPATLTQIQERVSRVAPQATLIRAVHVPRCLLTWPEGSGPVSLIHEQPVAVLSAIGNPEAFLETIKRCGAQVVAQRALPDHDRYSAETVGHIVQWLRTLNQPSLQVICTQKDLVKLQTDRLAGYPLRALTIELQVTTGEEQLLRHLATVARRHPRD